MQLYEFFAILDCVQKNALAVENTVAVFILTLMAWHRELLKIQKMAYWCSNQFFLKNVWLWSVILCEAASIANNLWNVIWIQDSLSWDSLSSDSLSWKNLSWNSLSSRTVCPGTVYPQGQFILKDSLSWDSLSWDSLSSRTVYP